MSAIDTGNDAILLERQDAVAIVSINDTPYNRMSLDFIDRLEVIVDDIAGNNGIRAFVLT